jgi:hypothetical protein
MIKNAYDIYISYIYIYIKHDNFVQNLVWNCQSYLFLQMVHELYIYIKTTLIISLGNKRQKHIFKTLETFIYKATLRNRLPFFSHPETFKIRHHIIWYNGETQVVNEFLVR